MNRLPIPGQDDGTWGNVLNDFLLTGHNSDGTAKNATTVTAGAIKLAGDLGGTANNPTVQNIARVYNVQDYGATGNGATDDSGAIQSALNAAGWGHAVHFPQGTYIISTALIPKSGQILSMNGAVLRLAPGATRTDIISLNDVSDVSLYGGLLQGGYQDGSVTNPGIQYATCSGVALRGAQRIKIQDVVTEGCYNGGFFSAHSNANGTPTTDVDFINCVARYGFDNGFQIRPGSCHIRLINCIGNGNTYGGMAAIRADFVSLIGGEYYQNGAAISTEGEGISFQGARYCNVGNTVLWGNASNGVRISETYEGSDGSYSWRGSWSAATAYTATQVVQHRGLSWYCYRNAPTGWVPSSKNDPYWVACPYDDDTNPRSCKQVILDGVNSSYNGQYASYGLWSASVSYAENESVLYSDGSIYVCKNLSGASGAGQAPGNTTYWQLDNQGANNLSVDHCDDLLVNGGEYSYDTSVASVHIIGSVTNWRIIGASISNNAWFGIAIDQNNNSEGYIANCIINNNGWDGLQTGSSLRVHGGSMTGNGNSGIIISSNAAAGTTVVCDGVDLTDNASGYASAHINTNGSSNPAIVKLLGCRLGNLLTSNMTHAVYEEMNGTGGYVYVDGCDTYATTSSSFAFLNPRSQIGRTNILSSPVTVKNGSYTLSGADAMVVFAITAAATATLPSAATIGAGKHFTVSVAVTSTSSLTLVSAGGSVPASSIAAGSAVAVVSDGTNWQRSA